MLDNELPRGLGMHRSCHAERDQEPELSVRDHGWSAAGTLLTARLALERGLAVNTAGGTHHAFPDTGSGFCILNDLAVTAATLLREGAAQRVLILDLDVHQVVTPLPPACVQQIAYTTLLYSTCLNNYRRPLWMLASI